MTAKTQPLAMLAVALAGAAWGLFWLPLRALDAGGISGVWAVVLFQLLPACMLAPLFALRWRALLQGGWSLHLAGILAGGALVLYAGALIYTDIVRALLLYYLTPIWSTLLARAVIREAITRLRISGIVLALVGLGVLLKVDAGLDLSFNAGDWMGLGSGLLWAGAAVLMNARPTSSGADFTLSYFFWACLAALALATLPIQGTGPAPDWASVRAVLPWLLPVVAILVIPPSFAVIWGAQVISPGLLSILFMTEITVGTFTAALWAGEHFGLREALGLLLISAAGVLEPTVTLLRRRP